MTYQNSFAEWFTRKPRWLQVTHALLVIAFPPWIAWLAMGYVFRDEPESERSEQHDNDSTTTRGV